MKDIGFVKEFMCLEEFRMGDTKVEDVSPAVHCGLLKKLFLEFTMVSDVSSLQQCKELNMLNLIGCVVSDFSILQKCSKLGVLYISCPHAAESLPHAGLDVHYVNSSN